MPYQDPATGEWWYKDRWYDEYPERVIEDYEEAEIDAKLEQLRDEGRR